MVAACSCGSRPRRAKRPTAASLQSLQANIRGSVDLAAKPCSDARSDASTTYTTYESAVAPSPRLTQRVPVASLSPATTPLSSPELSALKEESSSAWGSLVIEPPPPAGLSPRLPRVHRRSIGDRRGALVPWQGQCYYSTPVCSSLVQRRDPTLVPLDEEESQQHIWSSLVARKTLNAMH